MQSLCRIGVWLAVALGVAACRPAPRPDRETQQLLLELDGYISASNMYVARKLDQMDALGMLARSTRDPLRRYELEMNIAREFFAFSFDSTQFYLKHCQELGFRPAGASVCQGRQLPGSLPAPVRRSGHGHLLSAFDG